MRIDLQVPFDEKDEAKRCGARWDTASKVWYIPDGVDQNLSRDGYPNHSNTAAILNPTITLSLSVAKPAGNAGNN
ncbi:DUF5710 domain-containing protein [Aeromonas veronii]|uniref:DUF5710 domain-containing protein n=1 Tax=Aeromonas veronii TaxID=654 RepID=UPI001F0A2E8F|nr:DUF5710 domain-containing protein [Aeromonas veronii]